MARSTAMIGGAAVLAAVFAAAPAHAYPAALIVDVLCDVQPPAAPLSEAEPGDGFALAPDAEMIVIHYASCVESRFRGGEVSVGPLGVATSGEIVEETDVECPGPVVFTEPAGSSASVVLRGDGATVAAIGPRPVFVLIGGGEAVVELRRGGAVEARLEIADGMARWPAGAAPLAPGPGYEIALIEADGVRALPASVRPRGGRHDHPALSAARRAERCAPGSSPRWSPSPRFSAARWRLSRRSAPSTARPTTPPRRSARASFRRA